MGNLECVMRNERPWGMGLLNGEFGMRNAERKGIEQSVWRIAQSVKRGQVLGVSNQRTDDRCRMTDDGGRMTDDG